jgi:hypothetical protein
MTPSEPAGDGLRGLYRDVLRDAQGTIVHDAGWRANAIVTDCRRLLAAFVSGAPGVKGVLGLRVGAGEPAWDQTGPPPASAEQSALVDSNPFLLEGAPLKFDFLDGAAVSPTATSKLQVHATLGPGVPPWPDADHATANLREFGLVAQLAGATVLVNYVTHIAIVKDPASTLERTIWLQF